MMTSGGSLKVFSNQPRICLVEPADRPGEVEERPAEHRAVVVHDGDRELLADVVGQVAEQGRVGAGVERADQHVERDDLLLAVVR